MRYHCRKQCRKIWINLEGWLITSYELTFPWITSSVLRALELKVKIAGEDKGDLNY